MKEPKYKVDEWVNLKGNKEDVGLAGHKMKAQILQVKTVTCDDGTQVYYDVRIWSPSIYPGSGCGQIPHTKILGMNEIEIEGLYEGERNGETGK